MRSVGTVQFSPDGSRLAYTVTRNDGPGRPLTQLWIMTMADGKSACIATGDEPSNHPEWSPDGKWIAYSGSLGEKRGLMVARTDGTEKKFLASMEGTNSPLPTTGKTIAWSPDSRHIAYVSARARLRRRRKPQATPIVITRYLYKPTAEEGNSHFNDNKRLHIFVVDPGTGQTRQLTNGTHYEHSIEWSPDGKEIAFISNREQNEDQFFNYDLFALDPFQRQDPADHGHGERRIQAALVIRRQDHRLPGHQAGPDRPGNHDGRHARLADRRGRQQSPGTGPCDRQPAGRARLVGRMGARSCFTVQERGSVRLYRMPAGGGKPSLVIEEEGSVGAWSAHGDRSRSRFPTPATWRSSI